MDDMLINGAAMACIRIAAELGLVSFATYTVKDTLVVEVCGWQACIFEFAAHAPFATIGCDVTMLDYLDPKLFDQIEAIIVTHGLSAPTLR